MQEVFFEIVDSNKSLQKKSISYYDKRIFSSILNLGDRVLLKKFIQQRGRRKTEKFFENNIYDVVSCHPDLPIYRIKSEKGGNKIRTVHRNLLKKYNDLPIKTDPLPFLSTKRKCKSSKNQSEYVSYSATSNTNSEFEFVVVKRKTKQPKPIEQEREENCQQNEQKVQK